MNQEAEQQSSRSDQPRTAYSPMTRQPSADDLVVRTSWSPRGVRRLLWLTLLAWALVTPVLFAAMRPWSVTVLSLMASSPLVFAWRLGRYKTVYLSRRSNRIRGLDNNRLLSDVTAVHLSASRVEPGELEGAFSENNSFDDGTFWRVSIGLRFGFNLKLHRDSESDQTKPSGKYELVATGDHELSLFQAAAHLSDFLNVPLIDTTSERRTFCSPSSARREGDPTIFPRYRYAISGGPVQYAAGTTGLSLDERCEEPRIEVVDEPADGGDHVLSYWVGWGEGLFYSAMALAVAAVFGLMDDTWVGTAFCTVAALIVLALPWLVSHGGTNTFTVTPTHVHHRSFFLFPRRWSVRRSDLIDVHVCHRGGHNADNLKFVTRQKIQRFPVTAEEATSVARLLKAMLRKTAPN